MGGLAGSQAAGGWVRLSSLESARHWRTTGLAVVGSQSVLQSTGQHT